MYDNGSNLVTDDPTKAMQLLTNAYEDLKKAAAAGIPSAAINPLQARVVGGLDTLYGVVEVDASQAFSFEKADPPVALTQILQGPDGAPYVLDGKGGAVYRVDLTGKKATLDPRRRDRDRQDEGRDAAVHLVLGAGPADPRRQEHPLALPARSTRRGTGRSPA